MTINADGLAPKARSSAASCWRNSARYSLRIRFSVGIGNWGEPVSTLDVLFDGDWQSRPWKDVRNAVVSSCEQTYFVNQLSQTKGNVDDTARRAEINPRSLYDVMKRHGLKKEDFRAGGE